MTKERWLFVQESDSEPLTEAEIAEGWHFCNEMDGLLRQPRDDDDPRSWECDCLKP